MEGECEASPMFFVIPCVHMPIQPWRREPISVAISFDLLRKRRVMMEDVNVSNVGERWTMGKERITLRSLFNVVHRGRVVRDAVLLPMGKKKSDEDAKKMQIKIFEEN
jgi:hypothetical protein